MMEEAIQLKKVTMGYGERTLLCGVNATIRAGRLTALVGRNGSGKSTLLRAIAGLNNNFSGTIELEGYDIRSLSARRRAQTVSLVNTDRVRVSDMRCYEAVALGRAPYTNWAGSLGESDHRAITEALKAIDMIQYADRTMDSLSDGERQRIMIARAIAQDTPIMLLDEPTSFLDLPGRHQLATLLGRLSRELGKCVVFSTHELDIAQRRCDDIALVSDRYLRVLPTIDPATSRYIRAAFDIDVLM